MKELQSLSGIGPSIARDLVDLGIRSPRDLRGKSPKKLYEKLCRMRGRHIDRCVLYTFRCAVYHAEHPNVARRKLRWWDFQDRGKLSPGRKS